MAIRIEHDALGPLELPAEAGWGIHAERSRRNFPISGLRLDPSMIRAVAQLKLAAARAWLGLGRLPEPVAGAIAAAAAEVAAGQHDDQVVVDVYQAGAGTSFHMNLNELIANLANERLGGRRGCYEPVHPNDTVNLGQSTNDVFPTAMRLAALQGLDALDPALSELEAALRERSQAFHGILKAGRTHLQDAVPMRLGQEIGAWATAIARARARLLTCRPGLLELGLGGTAVGTGLNTPAAYRARVIKELQLVTGRPDLVAASDPFEAMQSMAVFTALSGELRGLATELGRIASDLRLLVSGPRTGLAELRLPALQAGSSIMPGKVNPSVAELVNQVAFQVIGTDATVAAAAQAGQLELNVMMPVIAHNLLLALRLLERAGTVFARRGVAGLEADAGRCAGYAHGSLALATALTPSLGYERVAEVAREAAATGGSLVDVLMTRAWLTRDEIDRMLAVEALTEPHP